MNQQHERQRTELTDLRDSSAQCGVTRGGVAKQEVQDPITEEGAQVLHAQFPFHWIVM